MGFKDLSLGVIVCEHVFSQERSIGYVCHENNLWQFMCGCDDHFGPSGNHVGIGHLVGRDPTIEKLSDLPIGWEAERENPDVEWVRNEIID